MTYIYLDHAATTPLNPDVLEAMLPSLGANYGNPSSTHRLGREAKAVINRSRDSIANQLGCSPSQLIFTSGGTESDNMALYGILQPHYGEGKHIITSQIEHHAVLHSLERFESLGFEVTYVPVDPTGLIHIEDVKEAIRPNTVLISIMYVNNEVGTLQPIEEIGHMARSYGIPFHVDAVQALGKLPFRISELPIDLMSISSHKINGPKGIGALYVAKETHLVPTLYGGSQERKRRPGTENVPAIAGFAKAVQITIEKLSEMQLFYEELRQIMVSVLDQELTPEGYVINGHPTQRVAHILNISFPGVLTESLLMNLDMDGVAAASGSACSSGSLEVSHVLKAMQLPDIVTSSAVRFSFGMGNSKQQIELAAQKTATIVKRLRNK
ncbi:Cysteine desulfurase [compost metagenome]